MKPLIFNIINAITLIIMGIWGYLSSGNPSFTALIPVFTGIVLLLLSRGFMTGNKTIAHIVVLLTAVMLVALIKPLSGGFSRHDQAAIFRVLAMIITSAVAMVFFIRSFLLARRNRKVPQQT
jgi:hypothetical protein